jgi:regulator of replication initiation timing
MNGGFSFRSMLKSGSKELQVKEMEMKIEILKNDLQCLEKMIVIMVANTNYEIEQYKLRRGEEYEKLFRNVAEKELAELSLYNQLLSIPQLEV